MGRAGMTGRIAMDRPERAIESVLQEKLPKRIFDN
jgi:hypothetical protein